MSKVIADFGQIEYNVLLHYCELPGVVSGRRLLRFSDAHVTPLNA